MGTKNLILLGCILILTLLGGLFILPGRLADEIGIETPEFLKKEYKLGLDLQGGIHLLYQADLSKIKEEEREDAMNGLRDVIERRVDFFGVEEPLVQVQNMGDDKYRLIVELAGVIDPDEAVDMIGETPYLDFREEMPEKEKKQILDMMPEETIGQMIKNIKKETGEKVEKKDLPKYFPMYNPTKLTGEYFKRARLEFDQTTMSPYIGIEFNKKGSKIFEELTEKNIDKQIAIYIDNQLISAPVVQEKITGGKAQITGQFTVEEAKALSRNLNAGALPVQIEIISQQNVGPSLGEESIEKSLVAGLAGIVLILLFMILIYRFSGLLAAFSLLIYAIILLSLFKLIPVTLTLSGIAGFILSLGMAVDANILVFERLREEKKGVGNIYYAINNAFFRAWTAIRDGNLTTLIICVILFFIASGFVQGFALTLGVGIIVSMFTVMVVMKFFMKIFGATKLGKYNKIWTR